MIKMYKNVKIYAESTGETLKMALFYLFSGILKLPERRDYSVDYREELKFICSDYDMEILKHRLHAILPYDVHQQKGCYHIRSLYFDTSDNACFYENLAGIDDRKKYRIRIYNRSNQTIRFEIKEKLHGKTKKISHMLTPAECEHFIRGHFSDNFCDSPVLNRICIEERLHLLHPAVIVDYERTAFTYPVGNVRITFDRNLAACPTVTDFFAENAVRYPAMPLHEHILEVKYDELLPDFIAGALELGNLTQASCSKYALCREACGFCAT